MKISYRLDIAGLRAVAVLSVLFFHAHVPGFSGGFVGVDIFFVISGFLIGGILIQEIRDECFSFTTFYQRRIRRILPVLLVVLSVTSIAVWFLLLPNDFLRYAKSLGAVVFMIPNIAAWHMSGDYFSPSVDSLTLLHLWSLGIEEQFYLLFPIILWLILRWRNTYLIWLLIGSTLASFILALWATENHPGIGFYGLPTRTWEFLLGTTVAYLYFEKTDNYKPKTIITEIFSLLGALLIIFAIISPWGDGKLNTSLLYQTIACIGATALIAVHSRHQTFIYSLLSWKPMVLIGLVSYSLYLWHWPLLSLLSYREAGVSLFGWYGVVMALAISFLLATLTWKYVEQPFRDRQQWSFRIVLKGVTGISTVLLIFGGLVILLQGVPQRMSSQQMNYMSGINDKNPQRKNCHYGVDSIPPTLDLKNCLIGDKVVPLPRFLVWGDSHSDALTPAFEELGKQYAVQGVQASLSGGAPLLNIEHSKWSNQQNATYQTFIEKTLDDIKNKDDIDNIFLVNRSTAYAFGQTEYEYTQSSVHRSMIYRGSSNYDNMTMFQLGLTDVVSRLVLLNKHVWIVLPIPETDRNTPIWLTLNRTDNEKVWIKGYPDRREALLSMFHEIQTKYGDKVSLLDPLPFLCRDNNHECLIAANGRSLYYDDDHLSATGARYISDMLRPAFEKMKLEMK